jgi:hypothetical protein
MPDFYTWSQFQQEVLKLMPQDADRLGMGDYLPRMVRESVIDLQQFIPAYTKRHESIYYAQDFAQDGEASVGTLPPFSKLADVWFCNAASQERTRVPVEMMDWERHFELVHRPHGQGIFGDGVMALTASSVAAIELINRLPTSKSARHKHGWMAVDPQGRTIYLSPALPNGWVLSVNWSGRKLDFIDGELVPFDEAASFAVAAWAKSKIAMEVDRDPQRAQLFMQEYILKRTNLYLDTKDSHK